MKTKELRSIIKQLKCVVNARSGISALRCILIEPNGFKATDAKAFFSVDRDTGMNHARLVNLADFSKSLTGLKPNEEVRLESLEGNLLRVGSRTLKCGNLDDFPNFPEIHSREIKRMPLGMFEEIQNVANAAVCTDETRPILTCVNIEVNDGVVGITATDSYRLARVTLPTVENIADENFVVNIPANGGKYFYAVPSESSLFSRFKDNWNEFVCFYSENSSLAIRLADGQFPNANALIPETFGYDGMVDQSMIESCKSLYTTNKKGIGIVELNGSCGTITTKFKDDEIVVDPMEFGSDWISSDDLRIGFNLKYLMDGLKFIGKDERIQFISHEKPSLLGNKFNRGYLLMPHRI